MKNDKQKISKIIRIILAIIIIALFVDFAFGEFLIGFNNPR